MKPPPLRNDCFAMPRGVEWTPVDQALATLREGMATVVGTEDTDVMAAGGRVLASDVSARCSNPPFSNSAVDGYGFAFSSVSPATEGDTITLQLVPGRAAAGEPFSGTVPPGSAVRILTGAPIPRGVDTVVLEEDVSTDGARIMFRSGVRPEANTRDSGEDVVAGTRLFETWSPASVPGSRIADCLRPFPGPGFPVIVCRGSLHWR